jgi:hypothetical protein
MGTGSFTGAKQPERDADNTLPSSADVTSIHPLGLFSPGTGLLYLFLHTSGIRKNALHDLTLITLTVASFVGTGGFLIS